MTTARTEPADTNSAVGRDTIILQCLAALLIANSHLEGLYPLSWMAADGLVGNSLFFFLSGFGLMKSGQKNNRSFLNYYLRRIARIYPALWLVMVLFPIVVEGAWRTWGAADYLHAFVYPSDYGYIRQIMVFYIPFYFFGRWQNERLMFWLGLGLTIPFAIRYVFALPPEGIFHLRLGQTDEWLWLIFYFQMMLAGGYCGLKQNWSCVNNPFKAGGILALTFAAYVGLKYLMVVKGPKIPGTNLPLGNFYFVLLLLTMAIVPLMFRFFTAAPVRAWFQKITPLNWFVGLAGGLTLEIYLTHEFIAYSVLVKNILFPLNLLVWLTITLGVSWLVERVGRFVRRTLSMA